MTASNPGTLEFVPVIETMSKEGLSQIKVGNQKYHKDYK